MNDSVNDTDPPLVNGERALAEFRRLVRRERAAHPQEPEIPPEEFGKASASELVANFPAVDSDKALKAFQKLMAPHLKHLKRTPS